MLGLELVRPLENDWRDTLDAVAVAHGWPTSRDTNRLAASVAAVSAAYNDRAVARATMKDAGPARLGFLFARDVPKGAAAVRELIATDVQSFDRSLRVLDLGAGLGAMTWGLARALEASGSCARIEALWVDDDARALEMGMEVLRARASQSQERIRLDARPMARPVQSTNDLGQFDLVLLGNVLSELAVGVSEDERLARHVQWLLRLLDEQTAAGGALVVVEPALRDRTRYLHRIRDALVERGQIVFAPCLHSERCPALRRDTDWCHEDLAIDLPGWLAPVARAAGLRWQGLTFSYLVVRRGGRLVDHFNKGPAGVRLRVVSEIMPSKGKTEAFLCGEFVAEGRVVCSRERVSRLDRAATPLNDAWDELRRGDILVVDPALDLSRPRVEAQNCVRLA
jgi:hypothetical protein